MSNARRHARNTVALLLAAVVGKGLFLVANLVIIKALTVPANGLLQQSYIFGTTFMLLTDFGLRGWLVRELSRKRDDEAATRTAFGHALNARLLAGAGALVLALPAMRASGYDAQATAFVALFMVYGLIDSVSFICKAGLRARERMGTEAVWSTAGRVGILALVIALQRTGHLTIVNIALAHIAGALVEVVGQYVVLSKCAPVHLFNRFDVRGITATLRVAAPLAALGVVGMMYLRMGTFVLSKMAGEEAVGYYNTAAKFPEALSFIPLAAVNALVPYLSRHHSDSALLRRYGSLLVRYLGFIALTAAAIFVWETEWFIRLMFKPEYLVAAPVLRWFGAYVFLSAMQYVLANLLICMNAEWRVVQRFVFCFVVNLVLNLVLVPRWGALGAAVALVAGEASATVIDTVLLARRGVHLQVRLVGEFVLFVALVSGAMLAVPVDNAWLRVGAGCAVAAVFAGGMALTVDREVVRRVLGKS